MFRRRRERDEQGAESPEREQSAWADYETDDRIDRPEEAEGDPLAGQAEVIDVEPDRPRGDAAGDVVGSDRPSPDRPDGPYDVDELADPHANRLDLGGMLIAGVEGMELRLEVDEQSGSVVAATAVLGESALQIQPFAAPRSAGLWDDVRRELAESVQADGGTFEEIDGPLGRELAARVPAPGPDGKPALHPVRFVGADGPRWFLRGVFSGRAGADPAAAPQLIDVFRQVVVVRGREAMGPREPIPLRLPEQAEPGSGAETAAAPELNPFERGPEITEIR